MVIFHDFQTFIKTDGKNRINNEINGFINHIYILKFNLKTV